MKRMSLRISVFLLLMLGDVDCVDERNEVDEKYQFLILGNVEANIFEEKIDEMYQFLISGNVEQQIVFICIITSGFCAVKREMPVHRR